MKGLTHFISGLAAATFFEQAVQISQTESSFILVLGGIFGILPDTLDFKFAQFFEKYDYEVDPDPNDPDPQQIADTLAQAINETHSSGCHKSIMLMTIKKGSDLWRQYRLFFDIANSKVRVTMGPLVNTSKKIYPGTELEKNVAEATLNCQLCEQVYDKETFVDIMSGASFRFIPQSDGRVKIDFLSWHRRWSHSLTMGIFLGIVGWLLLGAIFTFSYEFGEAFSRSIIYGLVIATGFCVHVLEDQLGYMGSNLFWPFTKDKMTGTKSMHSGDAWPNFATIWLAMALIFYNLNRFQPQPVFTESFWFFFAYTFIMPMVALRVCERLLDIWEEKVDNKAPQPKTVHLHQTEPLKEIEDNFG